MRLAYRVMMSRKACFERSSFLVKVTDQLVTFWIMLELVKIFDSGMIMRTIVSGEVRSRFGTIN